MTAPRCWHCTHVRPAANLVTKIETGAVIPACREHTARMNAEPGDLKIEPVSTHWERLGCAP